MNKWHKLILLLLACLMMVSCQHIAGAALKAFGGGSSKSGGTDVTASANFGGDHQQKYKAGGEELNVESNEGIVAKELTAAEGEFIQQSESNVFASTIEGDAGDITTASTDAPPWHFFIQTYTLIGLLFLSSLLFIAIFIAKMMPSGKQNDVIKNLRQDVYENKRKHRSSDVVTNELVKEIVKAFLKKINKD